MPLDSPLPRTAPRFPATVPARVWIVAAVAGLAASAVHAAGGPGGRLVEDGVYCALFAITAMACATRALRHGPAWRAWVTAAIGVSFWCAAEVTFRIVEPDRTTWYPRITLALLGVAFAFAYTTLLLLARARVRRADAVLWLDGVIAALGVDALAALVLYPHHGASRPGPHPGAGLLLARSPRSDSSSPCSDSPAGGRDRCGAWSRPGSR